MKKFLALGIMALLIFAVFTGCSSGIVTHTNSGQEINVGVNQEFIIAIGANPTTGHGWKVDLDETMLKMLNMTYKPAREAEHEIVGEGGVDYFRFKALESGSTTINMVYKRSWEEEVIAEKVFTVNID